METKENEYITETFEIKLTKMEKNQLSMFFRLILPDNIIFHLIPNESGFLLSINGSIPETATDEQINFVLSNPETQSFGFEDIEENLDNTIFDLTNFKI